MEAKFTIFFDDPFWVGVFERLDESGYSVARVVFGSEPPDGDVYQLILKRYTDFVFSRPRETAKTFQQKMNYKRAQREVRRSMLVKGAGTRAQQALKQELTLKKQERKELSQAEKAQDAETRFRLRQQKKQEKHRGH